MASTILILGAAQGIFLGLLLLNRRINSTANRVLAAVMFVSSVFLLFGVYYRGSYYSSYPHLIGFGQPLVFLFGPTLYLYALLVSTGGRSFRPIWLLHFLPYLLNMLYFAPFIFFNTAETKLAMVEAVMRNETPWDIRIIDKLKYTHGIIYVLLTIRLLRKHRGRLMNRLSSLERVNLNWLRYLTIGIVAVWAFAVLEYILQEFWLDSWAPSDMTPFAVAAFVYAIGYLGLRQPEIFGAPAVIQSAASLSEEPPSAGGGETSQPETEESPAETPQAAPDKYKKSGLTTDRAELILNSLLEFMEEAKPFVRSTLTLQELSDELKISAHNLSEVINTRLGKNFFDFVNGFRVKEVEARLADPRYNNLTILAIAQEAGFSSKSTFNTIFKKVTATTPSEYRRKLQLSP